MQKVVWKSLYFNLAYVLFNAKTRIYKQNRHAYTQSGAENSLFQVLHTIMRVDKPTVAYKLALQ